MHSDLIQSLIGDFALILMLAAIAAIVFKLLKQPLVLGYIVAGFIASPHFKFLPTVANPANISFWAQLGIVVLLFSLGLEFSFQKLVKVGGTALLTCLIIVVGMMGVGFVVGGMLGYSTIDAIFLGGMISMSSTTIIIKALSDLNLKHRSFVPRVMAVLIVEDLVAVVLLVILSSIAINKRVEGDQMLEAVLKLSFYLIIWFTVGIFVIPSLLKKFRRFIGDELLLIIAMGLCFGMATLAVWSGFSLALGAFVIGSILAGTTEAERIERIITPVKDLFGAVFFISVGMMVDPVLMWHNAGIIMLLAVVVVVGMITFGTFGMVVTGQPLKTAMESGFCLTQIGEFSFIIATTGTQLGVLGKNIYPIIVAVSVITTFFTPFFIKQALPCYNWVARHLPEKWGVLLEGYSKNAAHSEMSQSRQLWHKVVRRYLITLVVYTVVVIALWFPIRHIVMPLIYEAIPGHWGRLLAALCGFGLVSPFLYGIIVPRTKAQERAQLVSESGKISYVPLGVMSVVSFLVTLWITFFYFKATLSTLNSVVGATALCLLLILVFSPLLRKRINRVEQRFLDNMNERENRRTGKNNVLVSDFHLAYMRVSYSCPFVGQTLAEARLREHYDVNVVNVQRNGMSYPVPGGDMRIFPGDTLGVIGTDEKIQHMLPVVEAHDSNDAPVQHKEEFVHFAIGPGSPLVGRTLAQAQLRERYKSLLVAIERDDDVYISPTPDVVFNAGDTLWIVGDPVELKALH